MEHYMAVLLPAGLIAVLKAIQKIEVTVKIKVNR
jgi:hypothetical protein